MGGLKNLFTVPEGEKITEKQMQRVLVSSVCSILLLLSCLVSTTWAWFAVSIENTGNVIEIGAFRIAATVTDKETGTAVASVDGHQYDLAPGTYVIHVQSVGNMDGYCEVFLQEGLLGRVPLKKADPAVVVAAEDAGNMRSTTFELTIHPNFVGEEATAKLVLVCHWGVCEEKPLPAEIAMGEAPSYRNPLNGAMLTQPYTGRVFAVSVDNVEAALPLRGVGRADVFFEMFVNDYLTRGLALYSDMATVESVGAIRSTRYNFTDLAQAYAAVMVHARASEMVLDDMTATGIPNLNADSDLGYRDEGRQESYPWEHTLFAEGQKLAEAAQNSGYNAPVADKNYGMHFVEDGTPADGAVADEVEIVFTLGEQKKTTIMKYDAVAGEYIFWQYGKEMTDELDGTDIGFENVIVMLADVTTDSDGYHVANLLGSGEGYFACGGKLISIRWIHENETDAITFTLEDGTPLQQGMGATYVAVAPKDSPVLYRAAGEEDL